MAIREAEVEEGGGDGAAGGPGLGGDVGRGREEPCRGGLHMQPDVVRLREMRRRAAAADAVESLDEAVAIGQLYGVAEGLSDDGRGEPKRAQLVVIPPGLRVKYVPAECYNTL